MSNVNNSCNSDHGGVSNSIQGGAIPPPCPSFLNITDGEQIVKVLHQSMMNFLGHYVFGALIIIAGVVGCIVGDFAGLGIPVWPIWLILFVLGFGLMVIAYVNWYATVYVVTNRRVVAKKGLLALNVTEVWIDDIRGVNFSRGAWQAIFGMGNIAIATAATGGAEIVISGVSQAKDVVNLINSFRNH